MNYAIRYANSDELAGYPEPLVFATRKEASARKDKLAHQSGWSLDVVETTLPVNCKEPFRRKR